ncbi:hypothetical protein CE11_00763 [Megavirus courdo11]|uniref:Uncharacterized protein n=3 Tax=Megamimivirinae TaxID=3044648 RepID=A0A2L2DMZ9_MIMIV|nr:hypothetical protein MegaChil _gp0699 [Megavirus chiliensis]AEQ33452.1 hypothetical protein [Megavirus chiliensis]AFX92789.1 hypothetical protein CE11_00763 [Megavirus courdo11]AVG47534.1 hypothetical protein [Acanthamoeba polyphaga mimivirus]
MTTLEIDFDLSEYGKEILNEIFQEDETKRNLIQDTIKFIAKIISREKLEKYTQEIKKIIQIEKGTGSEIIESVEILVSVKKIIEDLYTYLESIKTSILDKSGRNFIKNNIDLIQQVVIMLAIDGLDEVNLIDKETLVNILGFVKTVNNISINMKIRNFFLACCTKNNND